MPVYKGTNEVTSGNLYKGTTEIENGYKATSPFYINETTVSWATPTGQSWTYTQPSPQSSSGSPGAAFPTTTFTITAGSTLQLSGTATIAGLPSGLSAAQSYNNTNPGNILTVTITGTFPVASSLNTALTISGLTSVTWYTATVNYSGLSTAFRSSSRSGCIDGAVNTTDNGSTWTGLVQSGNANLYVTYVVDQTGVNSGGAYDWRQRVTSDGTAAPNNNTAITGLPSVTFSAWSGFSNTNATPQTSTSTYGTVSMTGNTTFNLSGGISQGVLFTKIWYFYVSSSYNVSINTSAVLGSFGLSGLDPNSDYPVGQQFYATARPATQTSNSSSVAKSRFITPGNLNPTFAGYFSGTTQAGGWPGSPTSGQTSQAYCTVAGTYTYTFTWGPGSVQFTVVAS